MTYASAHMDLPPSANRMWRKGPFGMHPSAEYKAWKTAAATDAMIGRKGVTFDTPVSVVIIMQRAHKLRDMDNNIKPILDALQLGQMLKDDNLVHQLHVRWAIESDTQTLQGRAVRVEVRTCT